MTSPPNSSSEQPGLGWKVLVSVLAVAVVGLAVALVVLTTSAASDRDDQTAQIEAQAKSISGLEDQLKAAEAEASKPSGDAAQIGKLRGRIQQIEDCLPEIQNEINSLELDSESLFISTSQQISRVCQETVYGANIGE